MTAPPAPPLPATNVHHIAGGRRPALKTAGGLTLTTADDKLDRVGDKLDRALEVLGEARIDIGRTAERVDAFAVQSNARDREIESLATRHTEDIKRLEDAIAILRARPVGLTAGQLWGGAAALITTATTLATLVGMLSRMSFN